MNGGAKLDEQLDKHLGNIEGILERSPITSEAIKEAREELRCLLLAHCTVEPADRSIGAALQAVVNEGGQKVNETCCVLRFLAVPGLVPESNTSNQIARCVLTLVQKFQPTLWRFLELDDKKQTFEQYDILCSVHERICALLAPLKVPMEDIDGLIASRQSVLSALNNGIVKAYCAPFRIEYVRSNVEGLIKKLGRLQDGGSNPFVDVKDIKNSVEDLRRNCGQHKTFLTVNFFSTFLDSVEKALNNFLAASRGRFQTQIVHRLPTSKILQKHYPLHEENRTLSISIPLRSAGPGIASSVSVSIATSETAVMFESETLSLGSVYPGDFSAVFRALVISPSTGFEFVVHVTWEEMGAVEPRELMFEGVLIAQKADIDWSKLEQSRPYSTDVAKGASFVGRFEKVVALANKLLRTPMEPFYVTGQKRVGKTSLALAAAEHARTRAIRPGIEVKYLLWGKIAHEDPRLSMKALGEQVRDFLIQSFPHGMGLPEVNFDGSIAGITTLAEVAEKVCPGVKYVVIIDEFDEIHPELYQKGNLAETFFANIRAITTCENICIVLIGGENMPFIMDRQGQKLNKFVKFQLDYFSRDREWEDFSLLVRKPTADAIDWHDEAISEIFNVTNGNPYFAKIVCASILDKAIRERDADITVEEVRAAVSSEVSSFEVNSFAHLWQDGIHKAQSEREPDILRRCRALVAIARTARRGLPITLENVIRNKQGISLSDLEVAPVVHDFVRRGVLREREGQYHFVLPIFKEWLIETGGGRLIADALSEELAQSIEAAEDKAYVTANEISELTKGWPTYQGRQITSEDVRGWCDQVASHREQRILFKLLRATRFMSESEVREKLRTMHGFVRPHLGEFVQKRRAERRTDILITYVDGEGKSGQYYASRYAEENKIAAQQCILPPGRFDEALASYRKKHDRPDALVIVDDVVGSGQSLAQNLMDFFERNESSLRALNVPIVAMALVATAEGEQYLREAMGKVEWADFDFRYCELLQPKNFAFGDFSIWADSDEAEQAKALCTDIGVTIYPNSPLGFANQGLLLVFPANCPNNSLPLLHSPSKAGASQKWRPLFPRAVN